MDLNGDGHRDIISGGYPGELYLFPGRGDGTFAAREVLTYAGGDTINIGEASVPFAVDWDRDGDRDLLVGTIDGFVFFIPNAGGDDGPAYRPAEQVMIGSEPIETGAGDAGPCVTDWDGDGNHDLLLGCGDGSVLLFRNTAGAGRPVLADPIVLVPVSTTFTDDDADYPFESDLGYRAKIAVTDWNGDGRDDLLMGVFGSETKEDPTLTPAQVAERDSVRDLMRALSTEFNPKFQEAIQEVLASFGVEQYADLTDEDRPLYRERVQAAYEAVPDYARYEREMEHLSEIYRKYRSEFEYFGWVWLFIRK